MFKKLQQIMTIYDKILIGFILAVTVVGIGWSTFNFITTNQAAEFVVIKHQGQVHSKIRLSSTLEKKVEIDLDHGQAEVLIKDGRVRMLEMERDVCPLGICYQTGWIDSPNEMIVCVPNQIMVSIESEADSNEIDAEAY
ncbi:MAG: NusG domain II-containing protein [Bacillota bacterium]